MWRKPNDDRTGRPPWHAVAPALGCATVTAATSASGPCGTLPTKLDGRGVRTIYLGTTAIMSAAHRFYEKHGYVLIDGGELPASFPRMRVDTRFYRKHSTGTQRDHEPLPGSTYLGRARGRLPHLRRAAAFARAGDGRGILIVWTGALTPSGRPAPRRDPIGGSTAFAWCTPTSST